MPYDMLPRGSLHPYWLHEQTKNNRTYVCKKCCRGFRASEPVETCKFCGGEVYLSFDPREARKLYYRCLKCGKDFIVRHYVDKCECGERIAKLHDIDKLIGKTGHWKETLARLGRNVKYNISEGVRADMKYFRAHVNRRQGSNLIRFKRRENEETPSDF